MDHLQEAKNHAAAGDEISGEDAKLCYLAAISNILIALVERLDAITAKAEFEDGTPNNAIRTMRMAC